MGAAGTYASRLRRLLMPKKSSVDSSNTHDARQEFLLGNDDDSAPSFNNQRHLNRRHSSAGMGSSNMLYYSNQMGYLEHNSHMRLLYKRVINIRTGTSLPGDVSSQHPLVAALGISQPPPPHTGGIRVPSQQIIPANAISIVKELGAVRQPHYFNTHLN